ncbi:hypothetical protein H4R34_005110 [Dimargaris verticillata]|uniref:Uncharacterized protein n=1 Tax=Dimargaris verticillata TaxID=2761393 RepID=A0A9W8EAJ3_9FUNG|nr:hypothetical protein H4R34_005110 [Dimargaris verticillata]
MFPDCDPKYLEKCLLAEKQDHLTRVSNRLLDEQYPRRPPSSSQTASPSAGSSCPATGKGIGTSTVDPSMPAPPPISADGSGVLDSVGNRVKSYLNGWYRGYDQLLPPMAGTNGANPLSSETGSVAAPGGLPTQQSGGGQQQSASPTPSATPPTFRPSNALAPNHNELLHKSLQTSIRRCVPNTAAFDASNTTPTSSAPPVPPSDYTGEQHTDYCRAPPSHNLTQCGQVGPFMVYLKTGLSTREVFHCELTPQTPVTASLIPLAHLDRPLVVKGQAQPLPPTSQFHHLHRFGHVLTTLGHRVFGLDLQAMHIFYDTEVPTIAFNRGQSLFFNLRFFVDLHHPEWLAVPAQRADVYFYWFMVLCHELAHNFVTAHDDQHEFYLSAYAEQYLRPLVEQLVRANVFTMTG